MTWLNHYEIDNAVTRYVDDPVLGPAARYLSDLRDLIDTNSDGWSSWIAGPKAASKLCEIIQKANRARFDERGYTEPTLADVRKAITPIKSMIGRWNAGQYGRLLHGPVVAPELLSNNEWLARKHKVSVGLEITEDINGELLINTGFKRAGNDIVEVK
jgi:hypothetical protein